MSLMEKQRRLKDPKRPGYAVFERKSRVSFVVFLLLAALVMGSLAYFSPNTPEQKATEGAVADKGGEDGEPRSQRPRKIPRST